jgi:chain length determinant protein EpsF
MNYQHVLTVLRARWWTVCYVFGAVVLAAVLLTLILPNQYTATSSVVVDAKPDPVTGANGMMALAMEAYVTTQADVVSSERVAQKVVKVLKLDQSAEFQKKWRDKTNGRGDISIWIADYLLKKLVVQQGNGNATHPTNIIGIAVRWPDAKLAADLANAFAQVAIDTNIELKVELAKQYSNWFIQRSRELHAELEAKQQRLSEFQKTSGLTATDEKLDVENERLNELSTALVAMQGQRQDSQSRQRQVAGNNETLPEVLQSPLIATLKDDLSDAEAKQADIVGRLGRNHPDYQAAAAAVDSLHRRIAQETAKIAASLDTTAHVNVRRESELRSALDEQKKRVLDLKQKHDEATVLANDVTAVQSALDAVNQRLAQSNLDSQTQQSNVVQLTSASVPTEPSSPKLLLNLALGMFLGVCMGIGAAMFLESRDARIRDDAQLVGLLGVPLLAKIGPIKLPFKSVSSAIDSPPRLEAPAI